MINEKDALIIKLAYPDFSSEMVEYASQFIQWDLVPKNYNAFHPMNKFVEQYYKDYDTNIIWTYCHTYRYKSKYPRTE